MLTLLFTTFGSLFSVVNPFGTMPIFIGLTHQNTKVEKNRIALKTAFFMFIVLTAAFAIGKYVMAFFGISMISLKLTGGLIISISGVSLLSGKFSAHKGMDKRVKDDAYTKDDPSITPLTMPMLAGPGSISFLISCNEAANTAADYTVTIFTVFLVAFATFLILRGAPKLLGKIGASGLNSLSRFIGFIVIAIGIEYILTAVTEIVKLLS